MSPLFQESVTYGPCYIIVPSQLHPPCPGCAKLIQPLDLVAMHRPCDFVLCESCFFKLIQCQVQQNRKPICQWSGCMREYTSPWGIKNPPPIDSQRQQILQTQLQAQPQTASRPVAGPFRSLLDPLGIIYDATDGRPFTVLGTGDIVPMLSPPKKGPLSESTKDDEFEELKKMKERLERQQDELDLRRRGLLPDVSGSCAGSTNQKLSWEEWQRLSKIMAEQQRAYESGEPVYYPIPAVRAPPLQLQKCWTDYPQDKGNNAGNGRSGGNGRIGGNGGQGNGKGKRNNNNNNGSGYNNNGRNNNNGNNRNR